MSDQTVRSAGVADGGLMDRESGVAMLVAIMMMMVMGALSILVLGIVVSQVTPTHYAQKNTRTIFAAEAGVEAALGRIRTATGAADFTGKIFGDPTKLPCDVTGVVDGTGSTYAANIQYYAENPAGKSAAWLSSHLACSNSGGTGTVLPAYALITSQGQAASSARIAATKADRKISMIYQFETTTTNVKGGRIYSWNSGAGSTQLCLRADGTGAGSTVSYRTLTSCGASANDVTELWIYDTDYAIKLASSTLGSAPQCLTDMGGGVIKLNDCVPSLNTQLWVWHPSGNATWVGQNTSIADNGTCLKSATGSGTPSDGIKLAVGSCANQQAWGSFSPDPAVGPGAASVNTNQIVNYLEFGRCFDVTDTHTYAGFMISYPCKQDPPAAALLYWNHKWMYQEPLIGSVAPAQLIYVVDTGGTKYCLQSPTGPTSPDPAQGVGSGYYPTLTSSCDLTNARQKWVRSMATGDKVTSYTIRNSAGSCVGVSSSKYKANWSAINVAPCDGSTAQKWNAPADNVEAKTGNYLEETG